MVTVQFRSQDLNGVGRRLRKFYETEKDTKYPQEIIDLSLEKFLYIRMDDFIASMEEAITTPHRSESQEFFGILESGAAALIESNENPITEPVAPETTDDVFNGFRPFSAQKLGAMIQYIAGRGEDIFKTNLNKLLFYADLTYFSHYRKGISGATYINLPFGPVPDTYENVLNQLIEGKKIRRKIVQGLGMNAWIIESGSSPDEPTNILSSDEARVLDWVLSNYGKMSPTEISELSHREKAYRFTRRSEPIAYEYAKFFENLPPSSFWE